MNFTYTYDANGNITQGYDQVLNKTSVYEYDDLNRLSSADVYAGVYNLAPASYAYRRNYEYDKIGNLLQVGNFGSVAWLPGQEAIKVAEASPSSSSRGIAPVSFSLPAKQLSGSTWDISRYSTVNSPTLGIELWDASASTFSNGGMYAWKAYGNNTIQNKADTLKITYVDDTNGAHVYLADSADLSADLANGAWYQLQLSRRLSQGIVWMWSLYRGNTLAGSYSETNTTLTPLTMTGRPGTQTIRSGWNICNRGRCSDR